MYLIAKDNIEINKILIKDSNFKSINHHFIYSGICKKCK